jgi:PAS domain S-box-containing protein
MYRIHGLEPLPQARSGLGGFLDRVHPDDRERVADELRRALAERRTFCFRYRIARPGGELRVLQVEGRTVLDEGGKALRVLGTGRDVSDAPESGLPAP